MSDVVPANPMPDPWQMRAADADREAYVSLLQQGYLEGRLTKDEYDERIGSAFRATTYADLKPLLDDLPVPRDQVPGPPLPAHLAAADVTRVAPSGVQVNESPVVAIFSETKRENRWAMATGQVGVAVFGSLTLDLRQALLQEPESELRASAIFGSIDIIVPADIHVDVTGVGVFGQYQRVDTREPGQSGLEAPPGSPRVTVMGAAVFGSVTVKIVDAPVTGSQRVLGPRPTPPAIPPGGPGNPVR